MQKNGLIRYFVAVCLVIEVLCYDSVLFHVYPGGRYYYLIKLAMYGVLVLSVAREIIERTIKLPLFIIGYGALMFYLILPSAMAGVYGAYPWLSATLRVTHVLLFFLVVIKYGSQPLAAIFRWLGFVLAVQSLYLYWKVVQGDAPDVMLVERFGTQRVGGSEFYRSYGVLGFGNFFIQTEEGDITFRAQSFFSEATRFAMFQMYPFFLCLASARRRSLNLVMAAVIAGSIVITFSFSAFLGLVFAAGFYWGMPWFGQRGKLVKTIVILGVVGALAYLYFNFSRSVFDTYGRESGNVGLNAIAKSDRSATARIEWVLETFDHIGRHPLGIGFTAEENASGQELNLPLAPAQWFLFGGLVGGLIMLWIQGTLFFKHYLPGLAGRSREIRIMAAANVAAMVVSAVHDNWSGLLYFLPMATLVAAQWRAGLLQSQAKVPSPLSRRRPTPRAGRAEPRPPDATRAPAK